MPNAPRLRDLRPQGGLNAFSKSFIVELGGHLIYWIALKGEIGGDDFVRALGGAFKTQIRLSPLGLLDLEHEGLGYSAKTIKAKNPFKLKAARLIIGRASPFYSYKMEWQKDLQKTGLALINIYNERIKIALHSCQQLRLMVLVRSLDLKEFILFEELVKPLKNLYSWELNPRGNLMGFDKQEHHCFTWQPHGAQLTKITPIPKNALKFSLKHPPPLNPQTLLEQMGFKGNWVRMQD
ncbi:hypothetical protein HHE03_08290 [Helicobacter heilmannii]|nr:hypothetical protein HHE014_10990 [Helicobacter heilmannii]CRF49230.1 hypothetical protein HHE03_08290 [Helicobacter heilmannii]